MLAMLAPLFFLNKNMYFKMFFIFFSSTILLLGTSTLSETERKRQRPSMGSTWINHPCLAVFVGWFYPTWPFGIGSLSHTKPCNLSFPSQKMAAWDAREVSLFAMDIRAMYGIMNDISETSWLRVGFWQTLHQWTMDRTMMGPSSSPQFTGTMRNWWSEKKYIMLPQQRGTSSLVVSPKPLSIRSRLIAKQSNLGPKAAVGRQTTPRTIPHGISDGSMLVAPEDVLGLNRWKIRRRHLACDD